MPLLIRTTGIGEYLDARGEPHIKALILGEPSAGKTRSASFWPAPIFADCENGRMSIADRQVPFAEIKGSADMDALLKMLEIECTKAPASRKYKTLVIDTFDAYQRQVIQEILRAGRKEAMSGWQDWGQLDAKMTALVTRLQALPMNVVVNCHVKASKDGDDGPVIKEPKLKGDLRDQIAAEFDLVGYMSTFWQAEGGQRVLKRAIKWAPEPYFPILKDRSGQLPGFTDVNFTDEDFGTLYEAIFDSQYFEDLPAGTDVEQLATEEDATQVEAPRAGGPVPAKKTSAKKAAAPPVAKEAKAREVTAPVLAAQPASAIPAQADPVAEQAPGNARSEPVAPADTPAQTSPIPDPEADAQALVEHELGGQVVSEETTTEDTSTPAPAENALPCGTPIVGVTDPYPGCGRDLRPLEEESGDLINIAVIKTRTYLCPDCFGTWRTQHKK